MLPFFANESHISGIMGKMSDKPCVQCVKKRQKENDDTFISPKNGPLVHYPPLNPHEGFKCQGMLTRSTL